MGLSTTDDIDKRMKYKEFQNGKRGKKDINAPRKKVQNQKKKSVQV